MNVFAVVHIRLVIFVVRLWAFAVTFLQPFQECFSGGFRFLEFLHLERLTTTASLLLEGSERILNSLDILDAQLAADDVQITNRVNITLNVRNVFIIEAANHLENAIDNADVGQEGVTQTKTSGGTLDQTGDIIHGQDSRHLRLGFVVLAEPVVPLIGDDNGGLLGVNGGKGEIARVTQGGLGDCLEECRLADIGKTNLKPLLEWMVGKERRKNSGQKGDRGGLNSFLWN